MAAKKYYAEARPYIGGTSKLYYLKGQYYEHMTLRGSTNKELSTTEPIITSNWGFDDSSITDGDVYLLILDLQLKLEDQFGAIKAIVLKGRNKIEPCTAQELREYHDFLRANLPAARPSSLKGRRAQLYEKLRLNPAYAITDDFPLVIAESTWYHLLRNATKKVNTLLIGPKGSAKTSVVTELSRVMGLPLHTFDFGGVKDATSSLVGVHRLVEGSSIFDFAEFAIAIQTKCVILIDEINRAKPEVGNMLLSCLDHRRYLKADTASSCEVRKIHVHKDCFFIATANIGSEYTGTYALDDALEDRFQPIELPYLTEEQESAYIEKTYELPTYDCTAIAKTMKTLRGLHARGEVSKQLGTRTTIQIADMVADGYPLLVALESVLLPLFEDSDTINGERSVVRGVISQL